MHEFLANRLVQDAKETLKEHYVHQPNNKMVPLDGREELAEMFENILPYALEMNSFHSAVKGSIYGALVKLFAEFNSLPDECMSSPCMIKLL